MLYVPTATGQLVEAFFFGFAPVVLRLCNSLFVGLDLLYFPLVCLLLHSSVVGCLEMLLHSCVGCLATLLHSRVVGCLATLLHSSVGCLANVYLEPPPAIASPLLFSERMSVFRDGILNCKKSLETFVVFLFRSVTPF